MKKLIVILGLSLAINANGQIKQQQSQKAKSDTLYVSDTTNIASVKDFNDFTKELMKIPHDAYLSLNNPDVIMLQFWLYIRDKKKIVVKQKQ